MSVVSVCTTHILSPISPDELIFNIINIENDKVSEISIIILKNIFALYAALCHL